MLQLRISRLLSAGALGFALLLSRAHAAMILPPGSPYEAQLATWLGEGDLAFFEIFSSSNGDGKTSTDFHAAVDGQGRTFTLLEVTSFDTGLTQIIGGYNPQSWNSTTGYNVTPTDAERTAFIFNLTDGIKHEQILGSYPGSVQTYNEFNEGPIFGGNDIWVRDSLVAATTKQYSYGPVNDHITSGLFVHTESLKIHRLDVCGRVGIGTIGTGRRQFARAHCALARRIGCFSSPDAAPLIFMVRNESPVVLG